MDDTTGDMMDDTTDETADDALYSVDEMEKDDRERGNENAPEPSTSRDGLDERREIESRDTEWWRTQHRLAPAPRRKHKKSV